MSEVTLGLDLSDSIVRLVVAGDGGLVLSRGELPDSAANLAGGIREAARRAVAGAGGAMAGVAVALPQAGEDIPAEVTAALASAVPGTPAPLAVAAGTAAALAEQWCGAARGVADLVTFAIGEHVTAGVLLKGEPWHGAHGLAASVGYLALNPVEREDYRRYGGLEAEVSSAGIVRRLMWRVKSGDRSVVADQAAGDWSRITAEQVFHAARAGDGVAISVVRDTARYVGMAVANLATMFDPEAVVLCGMLAASGDMMLDAIRLECSRRLRPAQADRVRLVLSTLGADAVAIGAARAAARARP